MKPAFVIFSQAVVVTALSLGCSDSTAPVEVQLRQIEIVTSRLSTPGTPAPTGVDSGGNPAAPVPKDTRQFSMEEYQQAQRWATSDPAKFDEVWPAMKIALVEGRIDGVKPGSIQTR
jgi:hypothetical protein